MNELAFWRCKIDQFFHDPFPKPFTLSGKGHEEVAALLHKVLFEVDDESEPTDESSGDTQSKSDTESEFKLKKRPDRLVTGADRPVMDRPGRWISISFRKYPIVTHPLTQASLRLDLPADKSKKRFVTETEAELRRHSPAATRDDWQSLERAYYWLWRYLRERLMVRRIGAGTYRLLWECMPEDTRCPDNSIWDHLRMASAVAFVDADLKKSYPDAQEPWLFRFELGPIKAFLAESRTSRDLWISSFLLAELTLAAMVPIVRRYGPDAIIHPDLRGNPRFDRWLADNGRENALPEERRDAMTFASLLPGAFTAVLPRGGADHLKRLEELAGECQATMDERWQDLAILVARYLESEVELQSGTTGLGAGHWQKIWERQHRQVIQSTWTAVRWQEPEPIEPGIEWDRVFPPVDQARGALPFQDLEPASEIPAALQARAERLRPWVSLPVWAHIDFTREVFGRVNRHYLLGERGFDYSLTHHQLRVRHALRKEQGAWAPPPPESGEICSVCGKCEALWGQGSDSDEADEALDRRRQRVRRFWSELDPDREGGERLCGICAFKRFLIEAGGTYDGVNKVWAGSQGAVAAREDKARVPFPSTAAVAAQVFLDEITQGDLESELEAVTRAAAAVNWPRTAFPRAIPRLAVAAGRSETARRFLMLDAQLLFPETLDTYIRAAQEGGRTDKAQGLRELQATCRRLRHEARNQEIAAPGTRFALVRMDGDHMGGLLVGDPKVLRARWKDVLHPELLKRLEKHNNQIGQELLRAGWADLLEIPRLTGPSLQAFISRALAEFAHRVVPWVVEQEFGGRLIYCGGDDILALTPQTDALPMAARLQQLFSAPWLIDTNYQADAWFWRRMTNAPDTASFDPRQAALRFVIPRTAGTEPTAIPPESTVRPVQMDGADWIDARKGSELDGPVFPMLGPHHSLSAAIVYGHYKTSMRRVLTEAGRLLDQAKDAGGRRAVALSHFSRNGVKSQLVLRWGSGWEGPAAHRVIGRVTQAFERDRLPRRLPYKLRQLAEYAWGAVTPVAAGDTDERVTTLADGLPPQRRIPPSNLLEGLLRCAMDGKVEPQLGLAEDLRILWEAGFALHAEREDQSWARRIARSVDGLLLCRALAGSQEEGESEE